MKQPTSHGAQCARTVRRGLLVVAVAGLALLAGCASAPAPALQTPPKAELQFIDLQSFDAELSNSLGAPLAKVEVAFYDRVQPSALPERLQKWMAAVEGGGGSVKVVPPKSTVRAKDPFLLLSAVQSLWSASGMAKQMAASAQVKSAKAYDAEILLKGDERGDTVVDRVVFVQRAK